MKINPLLNSLGNRNDKCIWTWMHIIVCCKSFTEQNIFMLRFCVCLCNSVAFS